MKFREFYKIQGPFYIFLIVKQVVLFLFLGIFKKNLDLLAN